MNPELIATFWSRVDKSGDCWIYQRPEAKPGETPKGYGSFKRRGAHRFAYETTHGPIPAGMVVCHTCDNPPCVNPDHLVLGTRKENVQQAYERGLVKRKGVTLKRRTRPARNSGLQFRVREFAEQQGLDAARLARRANLNYGTVAPFWEDAGTNPYLSTLEAIAQVLKVPVATLFVE